MLAGILQYLRRSLPFLSSARRDFGDKRRQDRWEFSVRDDSIARWNTNSMGEAVSLTVEDGP
jgi:hypothetical protein